MKRNSAIKGATYILWASIWLMILLTTLMLVMIIHWHTNKSFYNNFYLVNGFVAGLNSFNLALSPKPTTGISLGQLSSGMMIWLVARTTIMALFGIYSVRIMITIFESIKNLQTFYDENIKAFKKLVVVGLIISAIACFNFGIVDGDTMWNFTIPFRTLIYTSFCYVMSEVFREGKGLQEESNSFV